MIHGRGCKLLIAALVTGLGAQAHAQFIKCVTHFPETPGTEVLFRPPHISGSTVGIVIGTSTNGAEIIPYDISQVVDPSQTAWCPGAADNDCDGNFFAGCLSDSAYEVTIPWATPAEMVMSSGVRLTTLGTANLPNPSIHLGGKIRFKMAVTAFDFQGDVFPDSPFGCQDSSGTPSILMCLGIRETGKNLPQAANDPSGGDLEYVFLPGSEVVPAADSDGFISFPPGGKRFHATTNEWPPEDSAFVQVEFNLPAAVIRGFANNSTSPETAGNGVLNATTVGDLVNRGVLESIIFTKDPADTVTDYFYIYFDDFEFEAPDPDPSMPAPQVQPPLTDGDTTVVVHTDYDACAGTDVSSVGLYVDGVLVDSTPDTLAGGVATFNGLTALVAGQEVQASQRRSGVKSGLSLPVLVFGPGVVLADDFDGYADNADLNDFWINSVNNPSPLDAKVQLTAGGAASCPNYLEEENPPSSNAARLYRLLGAVDGTDTDPLWVTWDFKYVGAHDGNGMRTRFELAHFDGGGFSAASARGEGTVGITLFNQVGGALFTQYNLTMRVPDNTDVQEVLTSNGWVLAASHYHGASGVTHASNAWHRMQIEVRSEVINYYIDGVNVNPADRTDGIPRPSATPYTHIIIGEGFSNNGPAMYFDNVSVTIGAGGANHPFDDAVPSAPIMQTALQPGLTSVTVTNVDTNATTLAILANDVTTIGEITTTGFASATQVVPVSALVFDDVISARQTIGGQSSCLSQGVLVVVPVVRITDDVLEPGDVVVHVADVVENVAEEVRIYANGSTLVGTIGLPATDPVSVTVTPLVGNDLITATQVMGGVESEPSAAVLVRNRPPMKLTVTLALDEDGNLGGAPADFEFVGAASKSGGAPHGKPLLPETGVWQEFVFSLVPGEEPVTDFAHFGANGEGLPAGQLTPDGGNYNVDSVYFSIDSNGPVNSGPYKVYVDHMYYINAADQKVLISDAETVNPLASVRGQSTSCLPTDNDCVGTEAAGVSALDGDTSIDLSNAVRLEWKWPNENDTNTFSVFRPSGANAVFPDSAKAVGFYVLFNDFTTNAVPAPDLSEPNIGDIDFVRVTDVDTNAVSVDLYRNGAFFATEVPAGLTVDFDVSGVTDVLLDQYVARQTTAEGTSELGFPRGITVPPPPTIVAPVLEGSTSVQVNSQLLAVPNADVTAITVSRPAVWGTATSTGFESTPITVTGVGLTAGNVLTATQTVNSLVSGPSASVNVEVVQTPCGVAFTDSFDTNTAANWNINSGPDASATFAFDYSVVGVPPSPNGGGTTKGLRLAANIVLPTATDAITLSPKNQNFGGAYRLKFDMWVNAPGPFPAGGAGSTQFLTAGVGYNNVTVNKHGVSGAGGWFAVNGEGEGGTASGVRDFRAYTNGVERNATVTHFFAGNSATLSQDNAHSYYDQFGGFDVGTQVPAQFALYPSQDGTLLTGAVGFEWHEVEVIRVGDKVTWIIDGLPIADLNASVHAFPTAGNISIGYMDPYSSVATLTDVTFGLIDNLVVEGYPGGDCNANSVADGCESIADGDWDVDGDVDLSDAVAFVECLGGPGEAPTHTDASCNAACLDAFDQDTDNDIDLRDFWYFQGLLP